METNWVQIYNQLVQQLDSGHTKRNLKQSFTVFILLSNKEVKLTILVVFVLFFKDLGYHNRIYNYLEFTLAMCYLENSIILRLIFSLLG